jgi:hypothetical protein
MRIEDSGFYYLFTFRAASSVRWVYGTCSLPAAWR